MKKPGSTVCRLRLKQTGIKGIDLTPQVKKRQERRFHPIMSGDFNFAVAKLRKRVARLYELQRCLKRQDSGMTVTDSIQRDRTIQSLRLTPLASC